MLWDLAPHDLSILDLFTAGKSPVAVTAMGVHHFDSKNENICYVHLTYDNNFVAHIHLNWVAPIKVRTITVGATKKMAIYDENLPTEKVKVYDKGIELSDAKSGIDLRVSYRSGDMFAPAISTQEALSIMLQNFHQYLTKGIVPPTDGYSGRRTVQILELANQSMRDGGKQLPITALPAKQKIRRAA